MTPAIGRFIRRLMLLIFAIPTFAGAVEPQGSNRDYVIKVWGADDGLTESSVTDIAQTPEGYLWVGTLFGSVLRFDGTRFVRYNSANTPEFSQKWGVPLLMVDRNGTLWISMVDGGLTTWDKRGFRSVFNSSNRPDRLLWSAPGKVIFIYADGKLLSGQKAGGQWDWQTVTLPDALPQGQQCAADAEGRIWYLQNGDRIGVWAAGETKPLALTGVLERQVAKVLVADAQGGIWIGTDRALVAWQTNHFEVMTPTNGEVVLNVKRIIPSGTNGLWVEANGRMRRCAGRHWLAESDGWNRELGRRTSLNFAHGDNDGGLWAGAGHLGLIRVDADGEFQRLTTRDGLPSDVVQFAYVDSDGDVWTGYDRGGLVQVRRRLFRIIGKNAGLGDSLINTVCEDGHGAIWIGTHSGIVGQYEGGVCTNLALPEPTRTQDSCVAADAQGRVWIGAQGIGLLVSKGGRLLPVASEAQLQGYPRLLLPDRDGRLWVGTLWSIISVENGKLTFEYTSQAAGDHPTALAETADGTVWAGTLDGRLLHRNGKQFVPLTPPNRDSLGRIWSLWAAPDGSLWAGTEEGGLLHWNNGQFFRYTTKDGLPSDSVVQILGDARGNLWLGTRAGIARIPAGAPAQFEQGELKELPVSTYGVSDGLPTIASAIMYQPSCWRGRDGTLLFAMANGVAMVNPADVQINPSPPTVSLEEMWADDKPVWPQNVGEILTTDKTDQGLESIAPGVKVGPGRGDLEFQYAGLSLGSSARIRFKYRLEGLENTWNDAGAETRAVYRHVPPGSYVFRVVAGNCDSVWSRDDALLGVTVSPFFYQTTWFRSVAALFALAGLSFAVAAAVRVRMRTRLEHLERQHEVERERTRIAQDLHDDLGAGLTEISLLGGLLRDASRVPAHKQEALDRIVHRCRDLVVALDEIVWAINPRNDSVNSLGGYLCRYAQGFLEPTTIRCRLEMHEPEQDQPLTSEQRHNVFLAFEEALTNVVRHSGATEVHIKISVTDENRLCVGIEDNGRGLAEVVKDDGDGLNNLRERMNRIGGQCDIINRAGEGVSVSLSLPLATRRAK
ncbi:MAG TPA: two-component regulator propeller domain-containing protein [Verrucomicrobiae bacterium]|jgi:signal transduction histidine kinase/ligand-binding sensor domain-containing protein|nr:two-component regulator propeller domain-containing protein [Verrucomicrobiae bacterium]